MDSSSITRTFSISLLKRDLLPALNDKTFHWIGLATLGERRFATVIAGPIGFSFAMNLGVISGFDCSSSVYVVLTDGTPR